MGLFFALFIERFKQKRGHNMTLEQYNQILRNLNHEIEQLQQEREALITQNQEHIKKQIEKRQISDRKWFVENFNVFWHNRHKFGKDSPNGDIVIDFFNIYMRGNKAGRVFINYLTIADFVALWDLGYKYQGYPIVEYANHTFAHKLTYIKDEKLVTLNGVSDEILGFSPVLCAVLEYLCSHKIVSNELEEYKTLQIMKNILAN